MQGRPLDGMDTYRVVSARCAWLLLFHRGHDRDKHICNQALVFSVFIFLLSPTCECWTCECPALCPPLFCLFRGELGPLECDNDGKRNNNWPLSWPATDPKSAVRFLKIIPVRFFQLILLFFFFDCEEDESIARNVEQTGTHVDRDATRIIPSRQVERKKLNK